MSKGNGNNMEDEKFIREGKQYIPGLGKYFKIHPDEIEMDALLESIAEHMGNVITERIEKLEGNMITKTEVDALKTELSNSITEVSELLELVIEEQESFLDTEQINNMIAKSLENHYTKEEVRKLIADADGDGVLDGNVTTEEELEDMWNDLYPY